MKKIVFLLLTACCLSGLTMAQSINDDLYYVPSKEKKEARQEKKTSPAREDAYSTRDVRTQNGNTVIVVKDRKGRVRDVDEYNRRYTSRENDFSLNDDTLYVSEKSYYEPEGEWVNGFDGSDDDYEYAMRIVRFRNPRYAVSISSPYYWDIVYGLDSWNWNVYTDGYYAYAFPTFSNRLWWDWRYHSHGWGWYSPYYYGWGRPYYGWSIGWSWHNWHLGWGGYYGGWDYHYPYYHGGWYSGSRGRWDNAVYTNRRSNDSRGRESVRVAGSGSTRVSGDNTRYSEGRQSGVRESGTARRVVGTRTTERVGTFERMDAASSRRSTYTRPSSTRSSSTSVGERTVNNSRGISTRPSSDSGSTRSSGATYSRGSSSSTRSYSTESRSSGTTRSSGSSGSYNYSSGSSRSSSSGYSTGGSSRSGGGGYSTGGGSSRSGSGGGSTRR